jgi:NADH:ubiquinone oxidoreductase subunit
MGFWSRTFTWWSGDTWGTKLFTWRFGDEVGRDDRGNVYYQSKKDPSRRWVVYPGDNDGSRVPPGWSLWLRGTIDRLPEDSLPPVRSAAHSSNPESRVMFVVGRARFDYRLLTVRNGHRAVQRFALLTTS